MAKIVMCEPFELYNLLNQCRCVSRLAEINYLCLIELVEVDSMQHVVVYDSSTSCTQEQGRAVGCAQVLAKASLNPVHIVRGGFHRFSALYPFLRTEKILNTIMELENLKIYPVEIIAGLLYMGDQKQGMDTTVLKDLKIDAIVSISESNALESTKGNQAFLNIPVADSVVSDLYSSFERICSFVTINIKTGAAEDSLSLHLLCSGSHITVGSRVLIVSRQGRSRCSAVTVAFLIHYFKYTLKEAWMYMFKCKPIARPNTGFLQQLSDWELHTLGTKQTDLSEHYF
ncbi:serine/threonine/tyrosine-interacting-like protein 1 isoform X3 [Archocentrus centrarchus]|uniref:serine/threonine/tyrosine-interacting-like protein 1 isoform X3 n=1 Tax=Archocentrus centrarchus TaxID=63155 RepID=UPI0011EA39FD|nr:serine/threonine/tyrosine-interacting-like protein 1 isoform X3 [Archocentrus centrarchus]